MNCLHPLYQIRITAILGQPEAVSCCSSPEGAAVLAPQLPAEAFLLRWCPSGLLEFGHQHHGAVGSRLQSGIMNWVQTVLEARNFFLLFQPQFVVSWLQKQHQ